MRKTDIENRISEFMERQANEQNLARRKEKRQVCIRPDSYLGREVLYQTALLHEILAELRKNKGSGKAAPVDRLEISERGRIDDERIQSGEATINEIRKEHGLPPIEGGDRHLNSSMWYWYGAGLPGAKRSRGGSGTGGMDMEKAETESMTVKKKMVHLMDSLINVVDRIAKEENAGPEKLALLPALVESIVHITGYAVIEEKS